MQVTCVAVICALLVATTSVEGDVGAIKVVWSPRKLRTQLQRVTPQQQQ